MTTSPMTPSPFDTLRTRRSRSATSAFSGCDGPTSRINATDCARSVSLAVWMSASLTVSPFNGLAAGVALGGLMHRVRKKEPRHPVRG